MVKVKERGRTKAPETSDLISDTRAAEPVPPAASPHHDDAEQDLRDVDLAITAANPDGHFRADALVRLAPDLPKVLLPNAVAIAKAIPDNGDRVRALAALNARSIALGEAPPAARPDDAMTARFYANMGKRLQAKWSTKAPATESKATVDNCEKTSDNAEDMKQPPDIGDATPIKWVTLRVQERALEAFKKEVASGDASPAARALVEAGMETCGPVSEDEAKPAPLSVRPAAAETTRNAAPQKLSEADLAAFQKHAAANQWNPESGVAASEHIRTTFADWLGRGLTRKMLEDAQPNLASAYATEIGRDPKKRLKGLVTRTYTRRSQKTNETPAVKVPSSKWIPVSELTEEQAEARRAQQAKSKRNAKAHQHALV